MTVRIDPDHTDARALFDTVDIRGKGVLEIGSGDGRFTWRYADRAGRVTAIEPVAKQAALAVERLPSRLRDRVELRNIALEDFASTSPSSAFDIVILSWSLC